MNGFRLNDLWILDLNTMEWSSPYTLGPSPVARSLHTANVIDNQYVFHLPVLIELMQLCFQDVHLWRLDPN